MLRLPDPRRWAAQAGGTPLLRLVQAAGADDRDAHGRLMQAVGECLRAGRDAELRQALELAASPHVYRRLWETICAAAEYPQGDAAAGDIVARRFAFPVVLVAAAKRDTTLLAALTDIGEIRALLEAHGAVGATRNFGLSNGWCPPEALESLAPGHVYRWATDFTTDAASREFPATALRIAPGREQAHLRFLIGAGIAPRAAPSFLETAANIGTWGMPVARALARQLAQPGLQLLAVPRPPAGLLEAAHAGRCAQLELAFDLFVSNTLRQFRMTVGDPAIVISAHALAAGDAEIRVSMSSLLDDTLLEGFRWPLHPLDDLESVAGNMTGLLAQCRVDDVRVIGRVLAGDAASDAVRFLAVRDAAAMESAPAH